MFSQRNNPYCELLQNCSAIIQQKNYYFDDISHKIVTILLLDLKNNLVEDKILS
jgi:hypothetical protein